MTTPPAPPKQSLKIPTKSTILKARGGHGLVFMKNLNQIQPNWVLNIKNWTKLIRGHLNQFKTDLEVVQNH